MTIFQLTFYYSSVNLWTWGSGSSGRLGNADITNRSTPVTTFAGGTTWKQVSAGYRHTAAIKTDGTLWTWGLGGSGRLGNAAITDRSTPVTTFAGGTNWKQVSAGGNVTAAIKTDGTLWTWGDGNPGQLGNADITNRSTPVTTFAGGTNWEQVSCVNNHTAAIKTDGTLWTWGNGSTGQLGNTFTVNISTPVTTFAGGTNWKQVSSGGSHTAAIKTDGTLWTWGNAYDGRLGNAVTTGNKSTPVTTFAGGTTWKQVSCGSNHTTAIKTDGTLWTWGNGITRQLGTDDTINRSTPVTTFAGGTNWKQVSCGDFYTAVIKTDGTLWTWGSGSFGQLGRLLGTNVYSTPVTTFAGGTNWADTATGEPEELYTVSGGNSYTLAIKTDGTLWVWGNGSQVRLGTNDQTNRSTPVTTFAGGTNWKQVSSGFRHTAAIKTDGTLWTWGNGITGQLGNTFTVNISTPVTTFAGGTNWKQVSSGDFHTAAIKTDGTLWTWGTGSPLGNSNVFGFIATPITTFAGGTTWKQVSAGGNVTAAIKTDGTLWTWGLGGSGRLGTNDTTNRSTPVTTFAGGTNWKQVSAGYRHTAAIKTDGTLWTWGDGNPGQLGNADITTRSTPVTTFAGGTTWAQVSAGDDHTVAIKTDGTLWTWGNGSTGQLGNTFTVNISTPVTTFAGGTTWAQVSAGGDHTVAIKTDGTLWGFGSALPIGVPIFSSGLPAPISSAYWEEVSAGSSHAAATKK
jgi:alpha-tubulin suppressor-like RCC1 family protein